LIARLESLADTGDVCISEAVRTAIGSKLQLGYEFMGEQSVKNIKDPIRAYQVKLHPQEQSQEAAREILRLAPYFSIKAYMEGLSFSKPEVLTRMEEGLRKAGLPE